MEVNAIRGRALIGSHQALSRACRAGRALLADRRRVTLVQVANVLGQARAVHERDVPQASHPGDRQNVGELQPGMRARDSRSS
jgi:hypothetical protein